ncbi:hypothetical protein CsSME_00048435 [Camellia sinensis var. sinensis]
MQPTDATKQLENHTPGTIVRQRAPRRSHESKTCESARSRNLFRELRTRERTRGFDRLN